MLPRNSQDTGVGGTRQITLLIGLVPYRHDDSDLTGVPLKRAPRCVLPGQIEKRMEFSLGSAGCYNQKFPGKEFVHEG